MSKFEPKNIEEALYWQLKDTVETLNALSRLESKTGFQNQLNSIKAFIKYYEDVTKENRSKKVSGL